MAITCSIRLEFDAAKRLLDLKGPCQHVHGYHHVIEAKFASVGKSGNLVMDYVKLQEILGGWIEKNWAHNLILNKRDKALGKVIEGHTGQRVFYTDEDPSGEYLAEYLGNQVCKKLFKTHKVKCIKLRLYDSENAWAQWNA